MATTKFVAVKSISTQEDNKIQASQTVTCTTTTRTTMTNVELNESPVDYDEPSCAQKPKILLYESTQEDNQSDILTDDDTNSIGSSIDSKDIEADLKEISQPITQGTVMRIDSLQTQMQHLSFLPPSNSGNLSIKSDDEDFQNMSQQFDKLHIKHNEENEEIEENIINDENSQLSCSVQTLSSTNTLEQESVSFEQTEENKNASSEVIVLSDTDSEDGENESEPAKRNISQEPPLKPTCASSNNGALYNISSIDNSAMDKVNKFFESAPFIPPTDSSFTSSAASKSSHEDVYVPETTDEESIDDEVVESSILCDDIGDNNSHGGVVDVDQNKPDLKEKIDDNVIQKRLNFSDNNIIVDIPVIKSTSDQPKQLIRAQSGVRLTASRSSPITKTTIDTDCIKRKSSNVVLKTPTSIRVSSGNGQSINIAAKININFDIQIVEDSSEESSEDNRPSRKSEAIQSSETQCHSDSNHSDNSSTASNKRSNGDTKNVQTPLKNKRVDAVKTPTKTPSKTPNNTPTTASKIKQFEYVPPKSMTKFKRPDKFETNQNTESKCLDKSIGSEKSENDDGFIVDKSIPINARDQKLLVSIK